LRLNRISPKGQLLKPGVGVEKVIEIGG